jgi:hypothetical protein
LPGSKAVVLQDDKRSTSVGPNVNWVENDLGVGSVVSDSKTIKIMVQG